MSKLRPVVLCGGAGTRLWPMSRPDRPKPLLPLVSDRSLLAETLERVAGWQDPWVLCGAAHAAAFALEAPGHQLIVEPVGRGTAPAAVVAASLAAEHDPSDIIALVPADHAVAPIEAFHASMERAVEAAAAGYLVTFGVTPRGPHTGFGWIEAGEALSEAPAARGIGRFVEKPGSGEAERLFAQGAFWNSGMFVARADRLLEEARASVPDVVEVVRRSLATASRSPREVRLGDVFERCADHSFDVAVMQRTTRGAMVPASFRWADVGTWGAVIEARGGGGGVHVLSDGPQVRVVGHPDVLVAVTGGAVLVTTPDRANDFRGMVHAPVAVLDAGPGWRVERRLVEAGTRFEGPGTAVILAGRAGEHGPGASLPPGAVASEPSTWLVALVDAAISP
ncbi:MAG: mannose-1-phosphate guanylyltransferase [Alphaproteobacteria bacterium]|nr:mannose-1-phosphate guanylyltransferase [Alphaproteobacteria bacterium]MCB9697329.1 mannose-1-phosphate guanylyltransferase [Alphaproteobacteria bacterium]